MNYYIYNGELYSQNELRHHGVKGQKWGIRRYQNADGSLTDSGKLRYSKGRYGKASEKPGTSNSRDHSKSDKSPLAWFAVNTAVSIMNLNPIGIAQSSAQLVQAGASMVKKKIYDKEREGCETDAKTGLLLKKKEIDADADATRVNPLVHNFDNNTKNNCMLCTSAYDLRRRGYEVQAKKASTGYLETDLLAWYPKAKISKISGTNEKGKASVKDMMSKVKDTLTKQGNGARGNLMIRWATTSGGHSVAYEIRNNKLVIVDAQIGKVYKNADSFLRRCASEVSYARLDNVSFNPKNIREVAG